MISVQVIDSDQQKGVKLDFKSTEGFIAALKFLKEIKSRIFFPVWINADVLPGPNADRESNISAKIFFEEINRNFLQCTVSPGWITGLSYEYHFETQYHFRTLSMHGTGVFYRL